MDDLNNHVQNHAVGIPDEFIKCYLENYANKIEVICDDEQSLKYQVQLDGIVMNYLKEQLHQSQQQNQTTRRAGYIYGFKHKKYGTIDYVGSTTKMLKERKNTHIKTMLSVQKLPFYRLLVAQMFQEYDMIFIERVEYYQDNLLLERERFYQNQFKSYQTNSFTCKSCNKHYQMPTQFEKHRLKCYLQEQVSSTSSSDQEQE